MGVKKIDRTMAQRMYVRCCIEICVHTSKQTNNNSLFFFTAAAAINRINENVIKVMSENIFISLLFGYSHLSKLAWSAYHFLIATHKIISFSSQILAHDIDRFADYTVTKNIHSCLYYELFGSYALFVQCNFILR